jgi:hypothetical protein
MSMILLRAALDLLNLAGIAVTIHGLGRLWRDHRRPDDRFWAFAVGPTKSVLGRVYAWIRKLFGVSAPPTALRGSTDMATGTDAGILTMTWGSLPSMNDDPEAFQTELNRRLGELKDAQQQADRRTQIHADAVAVQGIELAEAIQHGREEARGQVRELAVGGIREALLGLALIFLAALGDGLIDLIVAI